LWNACHFCSLDLMAMPKLDLVCGTWGHVMLLVLSPCEPNGVEKWINRWCKINILCLC
jgi:hypothetical protein